MKVSVIIVNYKTPELTLESVASVIKFTEERISYEIIVVDNASNDGSVKLFQEKYPQITVIENKENIGFGRANNVGIGIASGEFVFLLNSDAFLTNDAIAIFYKYMTAPENENVAVCGGHLFTGREDKTVSYGNLPSMADTISSIGFFVFYKSYFYRKIATGIVNADEEIKTVGFVNGADMFIRKSVLEKVGAFDEDFFLYFEETELSYRIMCHGYICKILPEAKIIHLCSASQKSAGFNYINYGHFCHGRQLYFEKTHGVVFAMVVKIINVIVETSMHVLKIKKGNLMKKIRLVLKG